MYDHIENSKVNTLTSSAILFISGMLVGLSIAIFLNIIPAQHVTPGTIQVDCANKRAFLDAQDKSRNGIVNGCNNFISN